MILISLQTSKIFRTTTIQFVFLWRCCVCVCHQQMEDTPYYRCLCVSTTRNHLKNDVALSLFCICKNKTESTRISENKKINNTKKQVNTRAQITQFTTKYWARHNFARKLVFERGKSNKLLANTCSLSCLAFFFSFTPLPIIFGFGMIKLLFHEVNYVRYVISFRYIIICINVENRWLKEKMNENSLSSSMLSTMWTEAFDFGFTFWNCSCWGLRCCPWTRKFEAKIRFFPKTAISEDFKKSNCKPHKLQENFQFSPIFKSVCVCVSLNRT